MIAYNGKHMTIDSPKAIRAITILQTGQRCEQWLPVGTYEVLGRVNLAKGEAVLLRGTGNVRVQWYVSTLALAKLVPSHESEV